MKLPNLSFPAILKTENGSIANHVIEKPESVENSSTEILCQNCETNPRISRQHFLCKECLDSKDNNGILPAPELKEEIEVISMPIPSFQQTTEYQAITFAPPSVRYNGKELDELAWSMMPAMPENVKLDIAKNSTEQMRKFINQEIEPTVQDLDVLAEYFLQLHRFTLELATRKKDRIKLDAKPELKRLEKERREKEKTEKIQSSIPKDTISKHTANVLLAGIAEIVNPAEKDKQSLLKKFLDYVSLQSQMEDVIDTQFLQNALAKPMYSPLKQYFKIKA